MDAVTRFAEVVGDAGSPVALDEASLLIAKAFNPGLDLGAGLWQLDDLAAGCAQHDFPGLLRHLVEGLGFRGNLEQYHDPRNSLLDEVLARRLGIPITLAVVTMEVGRRIGVEVLGIGMPGHFLVRSGASAGAFADPFHTSEVLDRRACRRIFDTVTAGAAPWSDSFLQPVTSRAIVIRMLNNLKALHAQRQDRASLRTVLRLRAAFPEVEPVEREQLRRLMAPFN